MFPPPQATHLNAEAVSGLFGSISITCWLVVFIPQIVENFRKRSTEGLSLRFIVIWTFGDVFNVIGGIAQQVIPTMLILAVYYVAIDVVLIGQFIFYGSGNEETDKADGSMSQSTSTSPNQQQNSANAVDATHLSPATPLLAGSKSAQHSDEETSRHGKAWGIAVLQALSVPLICLVGGVGWWVSRDHSSHGGRTREEQDADLQMDVVGQIFGYFCAVTYLGSRIPQILLNYQRKSTEGIVALFFFFACFGNVTYVCSILVYEPRCRDAHHCKPGELTNLYWRRVGVVASWLLGSFGTLFLDGIILAQFFIYSKLDLQQPRNGSLENERRPLLDRESVQGEAE